MSTRTKEEQQLLDEKIARIQKKNEEILRRQKEIEEDKRLAEQQNALVKLRPSTVNVSRERTPALKPSNRELKEDFRDNLEEPVIQRNSRGTFRGRGSERYRGQGDWKSNGPPPDPKSFLYDDIRDAPPRDREDRGDRKEVDRKRADERGNREDNRGGREFQRGGRRGGSEYRGGRRGRGHRQDEEAWRAERLQIDEARIQRQKLADGKWRREWDSEKIMLEPDEAPRNESRRPTNQEQWHSHHHNHPHHHHHHHQCDKHAFSHRGHHHPLHEHLHIPHPVANRGRGRGRLDITELEKPLHNIPIDSLVQQGVDSSGGFDNGTMHVKNSNSQHKTAEVPSNNQTRTLSNGVKFSGRRSIECVGDTVKISVPNSNVHTPPKAQRKVNESRGKMRSQTSYSSQSDEESSRDVGQRSGRRPRTQKYAKNQEKISNSQQNMSQIISKPTVEKSAKDKPPRPPQKLSQSLVKSAEEKEGDGSWEDVTTSGAESTGEELVSIQSNTIPSFTIMNSDHTITETSDANVLEINTSSTSESLNTSKLITDNPLNSQNVETEHVGSVIGTETQTENVSNKIDIANVNLKEIETFLAASTHTKLLSGAESTGDKFVYIQSESVPSFTIMNSDHIMAETSDSKVLETNTVPESFNTCKPITGSTLSSENVDNVIDTKTQSENISNKIDISSMVNLEEIEKILAASTITLASTDSTDSKEELKITTESKQTYESNCLVSDTTSETGGNGKPVNIESTQLEEKEHVSVEVTSPQLVDATKQVEEQKLSTSNTDPESIESVNNDNALVNNEQHGSEEHKQTLNTDKCE